MFKVLKNQRLGLINLYSVDCISSVHSVSSAHTDTLDTSIMDDIASLPLTAITSAENANIFKYITPAGYIAKTLKLSNGYFGVIYDRRLQVDNFSVFRDQQIIPCVASERIAVAYVGNKNDSVILIIIHCSYQQPRQLHELRIRDEVRTIYGKNKYYIVLTAYDRLPFTQQHTITSVIYNHE